MRSPADLSIKIPATLNEALQIMQSDPGNWRPIAGGTDVMVQIHAGTISHHQFVDLSSIKDLKEFKESPDKLTIGASVTFSELRSSPMTQKHFPLLAMAAKSIGAIAIQNRATIGGNVANASPAADSGPALLAYDAEIELISANGKRILPYADFHLGYKKTALRPDEIIKSFILPRATDPLRRHYFNKIGTRKAQAISKLSFAGIIEFVDDGTLHNPPPTERVIKDLRIAIGSVAPTVIRCFQTETVLKKNPLTSQLLTIAQNTLKKDILPINDIRSTASYRREVAASLLEDFLTTAS